MQEWSGCKPGWVFTAGHLGLGYYVDELSAQQLAAGTDIPEQQPCDDCPAAAASSSSSKPEQSTAADSPDSTNGDGPSSVMPGSVPAEQTADQGAKGEPSESSTDSRASAGPRSKGERHYWGQALQYLEKSTDVIPGLPHFIAQFPLSSDDIIHGPAASEIRRFLWQGIAMTSSAGWFQMILLLHAFPAKKQGAVEGCQETNACWTRQIQTRPNHP